MKTQAENLSFHVRAGRPDDISFLARVDYEASIPPFEQSIWTELLAPTGSETLSFLETMFACEASNWGRVEDFVVLEAPDGRAAAACAVFRAAGAAHPLDLQRLGRIAKRLGWSQETRANFERDYRKVWAGDNEFLEPQAEVIIESLAVLPGFRGQGLARHLLEAAFERGRALGARTIGIMVIHGNVAAQRLYERFFQPYKSYHAEYFDGEFPGITKYRAAL